MRSFLIVSLFAAVILGSMPSYSQAAIVVTMRTGAVDAINSITLTDEEAQNMGNDDRALVLFSVSFSMKAFESDLLIPRTVGRGETTAADIEFIIQALHNETIESGYTAGLVHSADAKVAGNAYVIPKGETRTFTMYVGYADELVPDRVLRLKTTGLTLGGGQFAPIELNASEVSALRTGRVEL